MSILRAGTVVNSLAAVIVLVPLVVLPGVSFYFDVTPKVAVLLVGVAVAQALSLPRRDFRLRIRSRTSRRLAQTRVAVLLLAQAGSLALSTVLASDRLLAFTGSNWRRFGLVVQLALLMFAWLLYRSLSEDPRRRVLLYLRIISLGGMPVAAYGILQYFGWDPWLPSRAYHIGEGVWTIVRPPGTLGHAAYFAVYLLHVVFAGVALATAESSRAWRVAGIAASVLGCAAVLLSGTRAALIGLAVGALFLRPRVKIRTAAVVLLLFAGIAAFYLSPAGERLRARLRWSLDDPRGGARLLLWRDTLRVAVHAPVAGVGLELFSSVFPRFQSAELARAYPDFYHESPHNIFLDALASQGVPGLVVLVGFVVFGFAAAWRARATEPALATALGAALAATVVANQFAVFTLPTALYFYATVALLGGAGLQPAQAGEIACPTWLRLAGVIGAAVFVVFAVRLTVSDVVLERVRNHLDAGRLDEAMEAHRRAGAWQPPGMNAELWYSRRLVVLAQQSPLVLVRLRAARESLAAAVRATEHSEEPHNAWYNLAALRAAANDIALTEQSLRAAIAQSPNWFKPHWVLAQVLQQAGRLEEAEAEAAKAADLNGGRNPEVAKTLEELRLRP